MKRLFVIVFLIIFIISNFVSAELFRGRTKGLYEVSVKDKITDDVAKVIKENPKRFVLVDPSKKGFRFVKTGLMKDEDIKKLLTYEANEDTLIAAISYIKTKKRFGVKIEREIVGKIYIPRDFIRQKRGVGVSELKEEILTDRQLQNILRKCTINGKGVFYDPVRKQNKQIERFTSEQLKSLIKLGPRQHLCIIKAAF